jgi:hypothetical protein
MSSVGHQGHRRARRTADGAARSARGSLTGAPGSLQELLIQQLPRVEDELETGVVVATGAHADPGELNRDEGRVRRRLGTVRTTAVILRIPAARRYRAAPRAPLDAAHEQGPVAGQLQGTRPLPPAADNTLEVHAASGGRRNGR